MIEFTRIWLLVLLPAPVLVWIIWRPYRDRVQAIRMPFFRQITKAAQVEAKPGAVILRRTTLQMIAAICVWTLTIVGLAGPVRVADPIEIEKAARDVVLALDISGSMDARDFKGADGKPVQRLEAVKRVIGDFIKERDGDRVSLIVFGSKAFVQAPFTEDLDTLRSILEETAVGMAGPNTVIGDAIGLAIRTFEASKIEQRLLILLSDGADTGSRMSPVNAAEIATSESVTIYTIGVGDPTAEGGEAVDIEALKDVAGRAGGSFFFADDENALVEIYSRIDQLTPRKVEQLSYRPRENLGHLPLGLAALCIFAVTFWLALRSRRLQPST